MQVDPTTMYAECVHAPQALVRPTIPFASKVCSSCGQRLYRTATKDGFTDLDNEEITIPGEWLSKQFSFLARGGHFTKYGAHWFVQQLFMGPMTTAADELLQALYGWKQIAESEIDRSDLFKDLDLSTETGGEAAYVRTTAQDPKGIEYWALFLHAAIGLTKEAVEASDAKKAACFAANATALRAMLLYKRELEPLLWSGYLVHELGKIIEEWNANVDNDEEAFWQRLFSQHSVLLTQIFAAPMVLVRDQAYVGGRRLDGGGSKISDYILKTKSTSGIALVSTGREDHTSSNATLGQLEIGASLVSIDDLQS